MGFFKRSNHEEEWDILSDEEYEQYENHTLSPSSNNQPQSISHNENSHDNKTKKKESFKLDLKTNKKEINFLEKDNGYEFEKETSLTIKKSQKWPYILLASVVIISSLGIIGYINTDFDEEGNSYIIPLNIHYKRRYAMMSDKVLDYINEISGNLERNINKLPNDFLTISNKLAEEIENLKNKTDTLSRYTNVPKDLQNYHSSLLNFSLLTQEFLQNLISSYNQSNYEEFAYNGLMDFNGYLREINSLRVQMDNSLFSNMESNQKKESNDTEYKEEQKTQNNDSNDSLFPSETNENKTEESNSDIENEMQNNAFGKTED